MNKSTTINHYIVLDYHTFDQIVAIKSLCEIYNIEWLPNKIKIVDGKYENIKIICDDKGYTLAYLYMVTQRFIDSLTNLVNTPYYDCLNDIFSVVGVKDA